MDIDQLLDERFGFAGFRLGQREVIEHVLSGADALVVMPTGSGKSLCFQVPALALGGISLVVSPLIALMKDQVDALRERGVQATYLNSSLGREEYNARMAGLKNGDFELLYVAPERFSPSFLTFCKTLDIRLFIIDEAHCLSQWGHDFRPDYLRLGAVADALGRPPTMALTATATPPVQEDILKTLKIAEQNKFIQGFDRDNLVLDVIAVPSRAQKDAMLAELVHPGPALVYAATRKNVQRATKALREAGIRAGMYHAGLEVADRTRVQEDFIYGRIPVVVATNAFGMGIDKRDVRCIVHYDLPGTLEAYYQEIGRAGRDGRMSRAVLLYNRGDRGIQQFFIDNAHPPASWIHRVYDWLVDQQTNPVFATVEQMSWCLPEEAGDRAAAACIYQLQREGMVRRIAPSDRQATVTRLKEVPSEDPRGARGALWTLIQDRNVGPGESISFNQESWSRELDWSREQLNGALRGLESRGFISFQPAERSGGVELLQPETPLQLDESKIIEARQQEIKKLDQMVAYTHTQCRRTYVVEYFGEKAPWERCGTCDVCRSGEGGKSAVRRLEPRELDVIRRVLACVARMDQHANKTGWSVDLVAKTITGSRDAKVLQWGFQSISAYGILSTRVRKGSPAPGGTWKIGEVSDVVRALIEVECLQQEYVTREIKGKQRSYAQVSLSERGWSVMRGQGEELKMRFPHGRKLQHARPSQAAAINGGLVDALKDVRLQLSRQRQVPPYVVASNKTLEELARIRPTTKRAMMTVHGIGTVRFHAYGSAFLTTIRDWNLKQ